MTMVKPLPKRKGYLAFIITYCCRTLINFIVMILKDIQ